MGDSREQLLGLIRQALAMADRLGETDAGIALDRAAVHLDFSDSLFDVDGQVLRLTDRD